MPVTNHWPSTQLCMDCKHGVFVIDEDAPASSYICLINVELAPGESRCELQETKDEEYPLSNDPIDW